MKIGFLHPGSMGVSIAASAIASGNTALWTSDGRSPATRARAEEHGLQDVESVSELCAQSDIICCICPPASAENVADAVAATGYAGIYVDANAISPTRMASIAEVVSKNGASVVDGGIIGHPAWNPGTTYLHLSGPARSDVATCFEGSVLTAQTMSDQIGEASALKMCYAALTKGTAALLCGILGTAEELGVRDALYEQWERDGANRSRDHEATVCGVTAKAWRWIDEMEEIASTFSSAGQPGGFHLASADIFRRLSDLKDGPQPAEIATVLAKLKGGSPLSE